MEVLSIRAGLTEQEEKTMKRLRRGYEGEKLYDQILDEVGHESLSIFRDIWIRADKSLTQIDSLIVSDESVIINEIKNYSGQYRYDNNNWYIGKIQISDDPLIQSKRAASKLIKIFRENNMNVQVEVKAVFPDPYFILSTNDEQAKTQIVKRDRLKYYFRTLNELPGWQKSPQIIALLESYRVIEPAHPVQADFERLTPGRYCLSCGTFNLKSHRSYTICKECGHRAANKDHVLRAVRDFQILFNEQSATTTGIQKLLSHEISNTTIKRYLRQYCIPVHNGRYRTYSLRDASTVLLNGQ